MHSSTLSLTATLDGVNAMLWPLYPPGKTRYPLYRRLCGPQDHSGRVRKISLPPGFEPQTVQPVANRYTELCRSTLHMSYLEPQLHHDGTKRKRKYSYTHYKPRYYIVARLTPRPLYPLERPTGGLYVLEALCI
jgi:hypothetical protein